MGVINPRIFFLKFYSKWIYIQLRLLHKGSIYWQFRQKLSGFRLPFLLDQLQKYPFVFFLGFWFCKKQLQSYECNKWNHTKRKLHFWCKKLSRKEFSFYFILENSINNLDIFYFYRVWPYWVKDTLYISSGLFL